ncbi:MAG: hypothetical protein ACE5JM_16150, partial [Armatimonadota bacterium]
MRRRTGNGVGPSRQQVVLGCVLLLGLGGSVRALTVEAAKLSRVDGSDPGTGHVFLRNDSDRPVRVVGGALNLCALADHSADNAFWWNVTPPTIVPGAVGDVALKLREWPRQDAVFVRLRSDGGETVDSVVMAQPPGLRLCGVYLDEKLDTVFVWVRNTSDRPIRLARVLVGGEDIAGSLDEARLVCQPGAITCLDHDMDAPLAPGAALFVRVATPGGTGDAGLVRAFSPFPLRAWRDSHAPRDLGLDQQPFLVPYPPQDPAGAGHRACLVMDFPGVVDVDHGLGSEAPELARRCADCREQWPGDACVLTVSGRDDPATHLVYGAIPDLSIVYPRRSVVGYHPEASVRCFRRAKAAAAPRPFAAVCDVHNAGPPGPRVWPAEARLWAYAAISTGGKGLFYRLPERVDNPESWSVLEQEIRRVNAELHTLNPLLRVAEPAGPQAVRCS